MIAAHRRRTWAAILLACGWLCTIVAAGAANMTVAGGGYQGVLQFALVTEIVAAIILTFAFTCGGRLTRIFAALGVLPLILVVAEFFRRYHFQ